MTITLLNCKYLHEAVDTRNALRTWVSPDERFAVAEVFGSGYFAAGEIVAFQKELQQMTLRCIDELRVDFDEPELYSCDVSWSTMPYGFCKLRRLRYETLEERTFRIYFDPELYKAKYEELNGVPYEGNKKFMR